jgi:hypothetical protein
MFSPRKRLAAAAIAAAACALVPAAVSAGVVVSSSGPSAGNYPVGKQIDNSTRIVLRAGDTLTVLGDNGTRVLRGAGTYTLSQQAGPSQRTAFANLTQRRTASQTTTGAGREDGIPPKPSRLWYVDVSHPGTVCVVTTEPVRLWRPDTDGEATYTLRASTDGASHPVTFGDGDRLARWDTAALPVTDGANFALSGPDDATPGTLTLAVLDSAAEEPEALVQQLIAKGCNRQIEVLADATLIAQE